MARQTVYDHYLWWGGELKRSTFYNMRVKYRPWKALTDSEIENKLKKLKKRGNRR